MTGSAKAKLQKLVDFIFRQWPRKEPTIESYRKAKIVAHRGVHDNIVVLENTLESFHLAKELGVWAIEFDIRWTRDLVPIVFHDATTQRVFGKSIKIADISFMELRRDLPEIPTLSEVIEKFGDQLHLMIELKEEAFPDIDYQRSILQKSLEKLKPQKDYHILTLSPGLIEEAFPIFEPKTCLLVAETNITSLVKQMQQKGYGGLAGHYLLMSNRIIHDLQKGKFITGCGFISSNNSLKRELGRNVDLIFTNHPNLICRLLTKKLLEQPS